MTSETDWSHDYCLYCDKQTLGGLYCSQVCRLADLEGSESEPVTPRLTFEPHWDFASSSNSSSNYTSKQSGHFTLPPPFDFDQYRKNPGNKLESPPQSPRSAGFVPEQTKKPSRPSLPYSSTTPETFTKNRSLNTSSSRSSLSSNTSAGSTQGLSEQAISQLQHYSNSFDHTRDWKRRVTLG